ncbi:MAG: cupin domain-containing protein [Acidobacteria bacterium]|nr:cupin domain-containing protein [Acidobacteriota bacterium]
MRRVAKPWGEEEIFAETPRYVGKILHVRKGARLSLQYHERKEESGYLLSGRMRLLLGEPGRLEDRELEPGACFHIPPRTVHRFIAVEDCRIVEVSTPEVDDVVRLEDDFDRVPGLTRGNGSPTMRQVRRGTPRHGGRIRR